MRSPSRKRKKSVNTMMVKSKRKTATFFATDVTCATMSVPGVFRFIIKYVSPLFLLVVIVGFCINDLPGYLTTLFGDTDNAADARKTWLLLLATIGGLVAVTWVGAGRWRAQGLDLDGRLPAKD